MKKLFLSLIVVMACSTAHAQTAKDLFENTDIKVSWLGIDYAHVKLIGKFDQFGDWGEQSLSELKNDYFPAWNKLVVNERDKYAVGPMLKLNSIYYDIEMMMDHNSSAKLKELEAYNEPNYTLKDIQKFVNEYNTKGKEGIGILFVAEAYNKSAEQGIHHFVAINMKTKKILVHERIVTEPGGFGLRNYWAGSIHSAIEKIDRHLYKKWEKSVTE